MKPKAYEGKEKYIFISYAHKDSVQVLEILERMAQEGYRLWYDDGIAPGSEWPEDIARHLDGCAVTVAFISNNSIASANCRREVTFALARHKPFLGIILEPTQMSLGMEMQLSAQQCILRYNYANDEDFIEKILSSPDLVPCLGEKPKPPAPVPAPAPEMQPVYQQPVYPQPVYPQSVQQPVPAAFAAAPPVQQAAYPPQPGPFAQQPGPFAPQQPAKKVKPPKKIKTANGDGQKKKTDTKKVLGIVGASLLAVILLVVVLSLANRLKLTDDVTVKRNDSYVTLRDSSISGSVAKKLSGMKKLITLNFYNCSFEPGAAEALKLDSVTSLRLENCSGIDDFSFLADMGELYSLCVIGSGFDDCSLLSGLSDLRYAYLGSNPDLVSLEGLPLDNLCELNFSSTGVSDISMLAAAEALSVINGSDSKVSDLSPIAGLTTLRSMSFDRCPISSVTVEFMSLKMQSISFTGCGATSFDGFNNFTTLETVYLGGNALSSITWLEKSAATLEWLDLSGNTQLAGQIAWIKGCDDMTYLVLDGIPMSSLGMISSLTGLEYLSLSGCGLTDVIGIRNLTHLKHLDLSYNELTDLYSFSSVRFQNNTWLDLSYNRIGTLSGLPGCHYYLLALHGNGCSYTSSSFEDLEGYYLSFDYDESISKLKNDPDFSWMYLTGCPADKQVAMEDLLGYGVTFTTVDGVPALLVESGLDYIR